MLAVDTCGKVGIVMVGVGEVPVGSKVGSKLKLMEGRPVSVTLDDEVGLVAIVLVWKVLEAVAEAGLVPFKATEPHPDDAEDETE